MSKAILAAIPIKPFGVAKHRLSGRLDGRQRSLLGKAIAARTAEVATDAGGLVAIVTGDTAVAGWAHALGYLTIDERAGQASGLDGAAEAVVAEARSQQRPWAVIHADLPLATPAALLGVFDLARSSTVLVPSYNGGTNIVAGNGAAVRFSYGEGSFRRHFAHNPGALVRTHPLLALDLDTEADLSRVLSMVSGSWLRGLVS